MRRVNLYVWRNYHFTKLLILWHVEQENIPKCCSLHWLGMRKNFCMYFSLILYYHRVRQTRYLDRGHPKETNQQPKLWKVKGYKQSRRVWGDVARSVLMVSWHWFQSAKEMCYGNNMCTTFVYKYWLFDSEGTNETKSFWVCNRNM